MREIDTIDEKFKNINKKILQKWIVFYYIDGEVVKYTSDTHDWKDLPKDGVQTLYRIYDTHNEQINGVDYYCPYELKYCDDINPWIKFGLYLDNDLFNHNVRQQITADFQKNNYYR